MTCLSCDKSIREITWNRLFSGQKRYLFCSSCSHQLILVDAIKRCERCDKRTTNKLCTDCKSWQEIYLNDLPLIKNKSVFQYSEFLKEVIYRWKYRGDYVLIKGLKEQFIKRFNDCFSMHKKIHIIPIPLSESRLKERGFNQAYQLASFLTGDVCDILKRIDTEKQAKKTRTERLRRENPFICEQTLKYPALLVDDIYTTGATIYAAAETLKNNDCPEIYSLTLAR